MFTSGTASGHNDLLDKLVTWLVGTVGWTQIEYSGIPSPDSDTDERRAVLRAPGATSGDEFFLTLDSRANVGLGQYGWRMMAAADYDALLVDTSQLLASPRMYYNLWQNSIDYWFFASDRRVIVVAKCNTSYQSMYAGLFLPFALPSEWPKPFLLAGSYPELAAADVANARNRFIADPGDGCAYYLNRNGTDWIKIDNHSDSNGAVSFPVGIGTAFMWPFRSRHQASQDSALNVSSWNFNGIGALRPLTTGEVPQFQCHIVSNTENMHVGALDGVYAIPGFDRTSGQLLSFGSPARNFLAFQNSFRTTQRDFMAIEEI
jgi:hypothetical protein